MIVFIGCVKNKKSYTTKACELYDSTFFKKCLQYAKSLNPDNIYILSAKYGMINLEDVIQPYDKTLNSMSKAERFEWYTMVHNQMVQHNIDFNEEVVWLCGDKYRKDLSPHFKNSTFPLAGMGIGCQLSFMTQQLNIIEPNITTQVSVEEELW
jgi:cytoplasmic iron level regulating protein YaaA (DUF328/UPF0246 family)